MGKETVERQRWQQEDGITGIVQEKDEDCFPKQFDVGKECSKQRLGCFIFKKSLSSNIYKMLMIQRH